MAQKESPQEGQIMATKKKAVAGNKAYKGLPKIANLKL